MDDFARLPAEDREVFVRESAARRDVTAIVVEKDFWVCWTLRRLMEASDLRGNLTFKGGTSLSKAYGIIHRFSEDIDLTIARSAPLVEQVPSPMDPGISGKELARRSKALRLAAQAFVRDVAMPGLARSIEAALGSSSGWTLEPDPEGRADIIVSLPPGERGRGSCRGPRSGVCQTEDQARVRRERRSRARRHA